MQWFHCRSVQGGMTYEYSVKTKAGAKVAEHFSPPLVYLHGQSFCGDGRPDRYINLKHFAPQNICHNFQTVLIVVIPKFRGMR